MYLKFLIYVATLFAAMRATSWLIGVLPLSKSIKLRLRKGFPIVELLLWIGLLIIATKTLFSQSFIYQPLVITLLVVGIGLLTWFLLLDFFAGLIMKTQTSLKTGEELVIENVTGTITRLGYLSVQIETEDGETEYFAFSKLIRQKVVKINHNDSYVKELIEIELPKTQPLPDMVNSLRITLLNNPLFVPSKKPIIHFSGETPEKYSFEIYVFALKHDHIHKLREVLLSSASN